jgi:hypothetical protein
LHLLIEFLHELEPIIQANLEEFPIVNLGYPDEIEVPVG